MYSDQAEEVYVQGVIRDYDGGPLAAARDPGTGAPLAAITLRWHPPMRGPVPARYRVVLLLLSASNASSVALADLPHAGSRHMLQVLAVNLYDILL